MQYIQFEGAREIGKPPTMKDEDCGSAWALQASQELHDIDGGPYTSPFWLLCAQPSPEDLAALNAGQPLWLKIVSHGLPPSRIFTMNPDTQQPNP